MDFQSRLVVCIVLCVMALPADDARPRQRSAEEQKESPAAADSFPPFPTHEHVFGLEGDLSEDDEPEAPAAPVVPDARRMTREERYAARGKATVSDDVEDLDGVSAAGDAGASATMDEDGFDSPSESAGRGKTARNPSAQGSGSRGKKKQRAPVGVRLRLKRLVSVRWSQHTAMALFDPLGELDGSRPSSDEGGNVTTAGAVVDSEPEPEPVAEETEVIRRTIYGRDYELSFESLGTLSAHEWRQRCIVRAFAEERLRAQLVKLRRDTRAITVAQQFRRCDVRLNAPATTSEGTSAAVAAKDETVEMLIAAREQVESLETELKKCLARA